MRFSLLFVSILIGALGLVAADDAKSPTRTTVAGTFLSSSGPNLAIETQAGNRMEFEIDSDSILPAGIEAGTPILVSYGPGESGVSRLIEARRVNPTPNMSAPVAREAPRSLPVEHESSKKKFPLLAVALIGILILGAVFAAGFLLRNRS